MPEGDTIHRTALNLRERIEGRRIVAAEGKRRYLDAQQLLGSSIAAVKSRGKHLLMHLQDERVIHSHMGMTGSWHLYKTGEAMRKRPSLVALSLVTDDGTLAVCFTPKTLELLTHTQFRRHPWLGKLGPDILDPDFDSEEALRRFGFHGPTPIGEAIMNQTILCGIGNVYKSEVLFLCGCHPQKLVTNLDESELREMINTARDLMLKNLEGYPRRTRFGRDGSDKWVYGRVGEPCHRCGEAIELTRQGDLGRSTYFCGACQVGC